MKKRKPPILLASVLVVMVGVGVIYTMSLNPDKGAGPSVVGQGGNDGPTGDDMEAAMNPSTGPGNTPGVAPRGDSDHAMPITPKEKKVIPKASQNKPNPNATSSQWYPTEATK